MHRLHALFVVLLIAPAMSGCGPSVSTKDMGTILYKIPHVQGADKPYELPKMITPPAETGIGQWTDGEKVRAIREGVDRTGRALSGGACATGARPPRVFPGHSAPAGPCA